MNGYGRSFVNAGLIVLMVMGFFGDVCATPNEGPGYLSVRDYGEPGMVAIITALGAAGANHRTLVLSPGIWIIEADLNIPANINLKIERGAILVVAQGKTVTLKGGLMAGIYQIFSGTSTVSLTGGIKEVYPQWWGAKGDGSTDDSAALQAAANAGAKTVIIPAGTYRLATQLVDSYVINGHQYSNGYTIRIPSAVNIRGEGTDKTILQLAVANTSPFYSKRESGFAISDLTIQGLDRIENSGGMKFLMTDNYLVERVEIKGTRIAFQALGCTNGRYLNCYANYQVHSSANDDARGFSVGDQTDHSGTQNILYENCTASFSTEHGFSIFNAEGVQMVNCSAIQNGNQGFYVYDSFHVRLSNCIARSNNAVGFFLTFLKLCNFENCQAINQGQEGFKLQGCNSCNFNSIQALDNSAASSGRYPGINLVDWEGIGSMHNTFAGCSSRNSTGKGQNYGLAVTGANSGANVISGGDYGNNINGDILVTSTDVRN